jgi:Na+/H+-dicarboxylate symporter
VLVVWLAGKNPVQFISSASRALITAFATSSSMATLPVTLMVAKQQRIDEDVSRFVLPLATTINLAGTAMYEAVSALFFCQILGFDLSIPAQIGVFITAILAGMGATGIPEGGLVTMVMVLRNVSVPTSAIGLLLPFDRILDRFRTMTNVFGDLVCAAAVDGLQQRFQKKK